MVLNSRRLPLACPESPSRHVPHRQARRRNSRKAAARPALLAEHLEPRTLLSLTFTVEANGWPDATRRNAAVASMQAVVNRHNAYGDFGNYNIYAYYNAGIPTAQASYLGSIGFGGTWPNERVTLHEANHYLGSGTHSHTYNHTNAIALLEQFDGVGARFGTDGTHFWGYGMNYDSEWSEINAQRNVALMYALRKDWGIGNAANPTAWAATSATLKGNDAPNESGFNFGWNWSDNTFAHPNADYSTGSFAIRTPQGYPSWTFAGKSLTVNPGGSLLYNSWGTTGVVTINNLTLNNATVKHDQFPQDTFQLAGNVSLSGTSTVNAANGPIRLLSTTAGNGSLSFLGGYSTTLVGANSYTGLTTVSNTTLALAAPERLADTSGMTLSGATFATNGFSETLGALSVSANSTINLGAGIGTLRFSGVGAFSPGATLAITNWTAGSDRLFIGNSAGLTAAQLAQITLNGAPAYQLATGEIVAALSPAPGVAAPASASPNPVTTTATSLSVLGTDDGGEAGLVYTWSASGPAPVTFSANATNAAKNASATFTSPGTYAFTATITDAGGMSTTSSTSVTVTSSATTITLNPLAPTLGVNTSQQFTATAADQFGATIPNPSINWSVISGAGSINSSGLYTAPATPGSATIQASSGSASRTVAISVVPVTEEIAWYKADESSGAYLADNSGHNRPATATGSYSFTPGQAGNALSLSGGHASLPAGILSSATSFTIATWVKLSAFASWSRIFDFGTGTSVNMFLTPQAGDTNLPRFAITTAGGGAEQRINSNTPLTAGAWTHVAVTLSGSTATLYINGTAVGSNAAMTLNPSSLGNTTANFIGKSQYPDPALQGSIDDFRIFARSLSAAEINALITGPSNAAPTVASAASASPSPVTGTTTTLSVAGADDAGEANLTYTWTASGPAAVSYSANGTNAAKNATATFAAAGTYTFTVTLRDAGGLTASSSTTVTVNQTLTAIAVSPGAASVNTNNTQQFTATATDQFGTALTTQPAFTWTTTNGSVSAAGLYTAPASPGSATVTATVGGVSGSASVSIIAPQLPAAPSSLTASKVSRKAKLSWRDNATNETGYHVWSSRDGTTWTLMATVAAGSGSGSLLSYTSGNLAAGLWYFRVSAYNAAGESGNSNTVSLLM